MTLVRLRSQLKTRIRSVLFKVGERIGFADILCPKARTAISKFELRDIYAREIDSCLFLADSFTAQIAEFEKKIEAVAKVDGDTKLLMTIPGISFFSALLISGELGDYRRFLSARKLACFAGLIPSVHASGGKIHHGHIIRQSNANLRFALLQAIPHLVRKHEGLARHYHRISRKKGTKTARIAISRKLVGIMLTMLKNREPFRLDFESDGTEPTALSRYGGAGLPASARASG
jgi:transposase